MAKLDVMEPDCKAQSNELAQQYHDTQQFISVIAMGANVVGAVASIAVILVFFTRLAKDIKRLQDRAVAIVGGYAGEPLQNTRRDEVGGLIESINRMQGDLRRWEQQLEIERQQRSHHEKMAAVGSLAAAIGHEVSNPIAAIAGVAQFIVDETRKDDRPTSKSVNEFASQILGQTERISRIMRKMATLTAPHPPEEELLDLNALIQSTCGFIGYDNRFRGVEFEFDLGHDVPAVTAVADHITQVLMNLLINAADAMDHVAEPGRREDPHRHAHGVRRGRDLSQRQRPRHEHGGSREGVRRIVHDQARGKRQRHWAIRLQDRSSRTRAGASCLLSAKDEGTTVKLYLPLRPPAKKAA